MNDLEQKILRNPPIENFLEEKFRSFGFEQLTNIQKKAIPVIYQKKNSLIIAPTGSGKTECSVIPIFSHASFNDISTTSRRFHQLAPHACPKPFSPFVK